MDLSTKLKITAVLMALLMAVLWAVPVLASYGQIACQLFVNGARTKGR